MLSELLKKKKKEEEAKVEIKDFNLIVLKTPDVKTR